MRDRLLRQVRRLRLARAATSPTLVVGQRRGRASTTLQDRARRPQDHDEGEHRARPGRPVRGRRRATSLDSYLHLQDGRGVNGVLVELDGRRRRRCARDRRCTSRSPSRTTLDRDEVDRGAGREGARRARGASPASEGKPEQAIAQDRRGPPQRLVQGTGAARAGPRADEKQTIQQMLGDSASIVRFAQAVIGS